MGLGLGWRGFLVITLGSMGRVNGRVLSPLVLEAVWNGWEDRENMAGIDMVLKTVTQSLWSRGLESFAVQCRAM